MSEEQQWSKDSPFPAPSSSPQRHRPHQASRLNTPRRKKAPVKFDYESASESSPGYISSSCSTSGDAKQTGSSNGELKQLSDSPAKSSRELLNLPVLNSNRRTTLRIETGQPTRIGTRRNINASQPVELPCVLSSSKPKTPGKKLYSNPTILRRTKPKTVYDPLSDPADYPILKEHEKMAATKGVVVVNTKAPSAAKMIRAARTDDEIVPETEESASGSEVEAGNATKESLNLPQSEAGSSRPYFPSSISSLPTPSSTSLRKPLANSNCQLELSFLHGPDPVAEHSSAIVNIRKLASESPVKFASGGTAKKKKRGSELFKIVRKDERRLISFDLLSPPSSDASATNAARRESIAQQVPVTEEIQTTKGLSAVLKDHEVEVTVCSRRFSSCSDSSVSDLNKSTLPSQDSRTQPDPNRRKSGRGCFIPHHGIAENNSASEEEVAKALEFLKIAPTSILEVPVVEKEVEVPFTHYAEVVSTETVEDGWGNEDWDNDEGVVIWNTSQPVSAPPSPPFNLSPLPTPVMHSTTILDLSSSSPAQKLPAKKILAESIVNGLSSPPPMKTDKKMKRRIVVSSESENEGEVAVVQREGNGKRKAVAPPPRKRNPFIDDSISGSDDEDDLEAEESGEFDSFIVPDDVEDSEEESDEDEDGDDSGVIRWSPPPKPTPRRPRTLDLCSSPTTSPAVSKTKFKSKKHIVISSDSEKEYASSNGGIEVVSPSRLPLKLKSKRSTKISSPKKQSKKSLQDHREHVALSLAQELDKHVFGGQIIKWLDGGIEWRNSLRTTAGMSRWNRTKDSNGDWVHHCKIELSTKVLDTDEKVLNTTAHEMCHLATWVISNETKQSHGKDFKNWGKKCMRYRRDLEITVRHDYEIVKKFEWECGGCKSRYGRDTKSIDITKVCCGRCRGKLVPLFNAPATPAKPNAFQEYLKKNMAAEKLNSPGLSHGDLMRKLGEGYKREKSKSGEKDVNALTGLMKEVTVIDADD